MNKFLTIYSILLFTNSVFAQTISFTFGGSTLCKEKVEQISFLPSGNFNQNNVFKIQLSDSLGSFEKAIELTKFSDVNPRNIDFNLPDTTQLGSKYRIRIISTDPEIISNDNGEDLSVINNCQVIIPPLPIITLQDLSSNHFCTPESLSIHWSITNNTFSETDSLIIQLSDTSGTFNSPTNLAKVSASDTLKLIIFPDTLVESNKYRIRIINSDVSVISNDNGSDIAIHATPKPVILSNKIGYTSPQNVCAEDLTFFRIQGWGGTHGILKYNGVDVYTGSNTDYQPMPEQSGTYTIHWTENGCMGVSTDLVLNIYSKPSAQLTGNKIVNTLDSLNYITLIANGKSPYKVTIAGIDSTFQFEQDTNIIAIKPTKTTTYSVTSISNFCGIGKVFGTATITHCPKTIVLEGKKDNYSGVSITQETDFTNGQIIANNQITENSNVTYNSGGSITLNPGFSTSSGVVFKAQIGGCNIKETIKDTTNKIIVIPIIVPTDTLIIPTDTLIIPTDTLIIPTDTLIIPTDTTIIASKFKIGFQKLYGNATQIITEMTEFANKGATLFETTIRLEEVFKSLSQFNETDPAKLNQYWSKFDKIIEQANNLYSDVVLRIAVDYDDTRYYFQERNENNPHAEVYTNFDNALFNLFGGEIIQDQFGNPARIGYGSGHGSFASMSAKAKMTGFVQKVIDRYYPILKQKLYWVSVTTSAQFETGMSYENAWNGVDFTDPKPCEYDYSPENIYQFRTWLVNERYGNLENINAAYGTNYTEFSQIQPPKVNVGSLNEMNGSNIQAMYNTVLFEDWYKFSYKQLKNFLLECKEIVKAKNNTIKFCFEAGSNTDQLSSARKTFNIPDINTYADVLKTTFQTSSFNGNRTWDADLVRSNFTGEIESEINESDVVTIGGITDPTTVKQKMLEYSKMAYLNHAKAIIFIADKNTQYYNNSLETLGEFKTWIDNHTEQFSEGQTIEVKLSDLIKNFQGAIAPFNELAPALPANGFENRPKIIINTNN